MTTVINNDFQIQYLSARIVDESELYIIYNAWHPTYQKLMPKKIRLNSLRKKMSNKTELTRHVRKLAHEINVNLAAGRNPFVESTTPKAFHKLSEAIAMFLKLKERDMRLDGFRSYASNCKKLNAWLDSHDLKQCYVIAFTTDTALELMNELALSDCLNNRTWNNHFVFFRSLWNWLIANKYCTINVFENFSKKREEEKFRNVIPELHHHRIAMYCQQFNPNMNSSLEIRLPNSSTGKRNPRPTS